MNIEGRCKTCGRTFLLSQIGSDSDAPGRCPFCGAYFARHYSTVIGEAAAEAEAAASHFARALSQLRGMGTGFDLDVEGLLRDVADQIKATEPRAADLAP
ncbi:MAG: hypothetical protein ABR505_08240 [Actinomycetota bacterium]